MTTPTPDWRERIVMMLKNEQVETHFVEMLVDYLDENITQVEQRAREEEAYLWFNTWYHKTINPKDGEEPYFGKWASERLQTLGATDTPPLTSDNDR